MLILYSRMSIIEDCRLMREINMVCGEVANVVQERGYFLEKLDMFAGRVVPEKTVEFLKEIQGKDRQKMLQLQILGRETELRAREKDLFIEKLKAIDGDVPVLHVEDVLKWIWKTFCWPSVAKIYRGVIRGSAGLCFSTSS
ncbi:hypothetical protein Tco_0583137 [Tanacetum coccineum]